MRAESRTPIRSSRPHRAWASIPPPAWRWRTPHNGVRAAASAGMMTIMVPDLLPPTEEMRRLCLAVADDLHAVVGLLRAAEG